MAFPVLSEVQHESFRRRRNFCQRYVRHAKIVLRYYELSSWITRRLCICQQRPKKTSLVVLTPKVAVYSEFALPPPRRGIFCKGVCLIEGSYALI